MQKKKYFTSLTNLIELASFTIGCIYILPSCDCKIGYKPEVAACALFLGWLNLILYLRRYAKPGGGGGRGEGEEVEGKEGGGGGEVEGEEGEGEGEEGEGEEGDGEEGRARRWRARGKWSKS